MYKLKIFSIGKTKEAWLKEAIEEYSKRLEPILSIQWILAKDDSQLIALLAKETAYIALDPKGKMFTSEDFSTWLIQSLEAQDSRLNLVIGGAEGLPPPVAERALAKISLSKLTFTHQLTRLIMLEQIYRAFEIDRGSKYHK
jgi:23S rRNA (pseudouridine1915-N3)-methyltransferase